MILEISGNDGLTYVGVVVEREGDRVLLGDYTVGQTLRYSGFQQALEIYAFARVGLIGNVDTLVKGKRYVNLANAVSWREHEDNLRAFLNSDQDIFIYDQTLAESSNEETSLVVRKKLADFGKALDELERNL